MEVQWGWVSGTLLAVLLAGCGGGGGGDDTAPAPTGPVDISALTKPSTGTSASFSLSGQISQAGTSFATNADTAVSVGSSTTFDGQAVLPLETSVTLRVPSEGAVFSTGGTTFRTADGVMVGSIDDDGVTCFATSAAVLPATVQVGDSGFDSALTCSDGSTETYRWRAEAGNGTLNFVVAAEFVNGTETASGLEVWRLNADGVPQSLRLEGQESDPGGLITFTLDGPATAVNF